MPPLTFRFPLRLWASITALGALGAALACGPPPPSPPREDSTAAGANVVVTAGDLEIREARMQIFGEVGAAFFTIHNTGAEGDRLLRVEADGARDVQTHETVTDGSVMRMEARSEGFELLPGETLRLEPGGKHVMLLGVEAPPPGSETFPLRLLFEEAGTVEVAAALSGPNSRGSGDPEAADKPVDGEL